MDISSTWNCVDGRVQGGRNMNISLELDMKSLLMSVYCGVA